MTLQSAAKTGIAVVAFLGAFALGAFGPVGKPSGSPAPSPSAKPTLSTAQTQALTQDVTSRGAEIVSPISTTLTQTATFTGRIQGQCVPIRAIFGDDGKLLSSAQDGQPVPCPSSSSKP